MDAAIILVIALLLCLKTANEPAAMTADFVEEQPAVQLASKVNETFYEDLHAFEVVMNGLDFH